ncbi:MAG: diguanylate cyclase [Eubacterium sp.]|nr:diguanylate cyclase [Eubacterium sp.]
MSRSKVTKLAFAIVFICFLLSTFVSMWSLDHMVRHNMNEMNKMMAARIYEQISQELSEPLLFSRTMSSDSFLAKAIEQEGSLTEEEASHMMGEFLTDMREGLGCEKAFVVSADSLRYYSDKGLEKVVDPDTVEYDKWYTEFLDRNREYYLDVDVDELNRDIWTVFANCRMEREGKLLGVCGVGVHMTRTQDLIRALEKEYQVKINLIDSNGLIQLDTDEGNIEKAYLKDLELGGSDNSDYICSKTGRGQYVVTKYIKDLDWYLVVQNSGDNGKWQFINVIVLNLALFFFVLAILIFAIRIIAMRTITLSEASFKDQSTRLLNRRAFEEEKARLMNNMTLGEDFIYVTADVNGLKTVNDTLGHAAGDELIQGAAACLKKCFGKYGKIYRIGGDEFALILSLPEKRIEGLKKEFETVMTAWSGEKVKDLSVSLGYASAREFPSENLAELSRISDERMYEAKAEYYRVSGKDRRKQ